MAEYTVLSIISKREKNTRFLIQDNAGNYYSIKVKTGRYELGDIVTEEFVESADNRWIMAYENTNEIFPRKKMMEHLRWYKQVSLHDPINGSFQNKVYRHIFDSPEKNLLGEYGYKKELISTMKKLGGELRSDFTHLTSSQAFAVNFFVPLIAEKQLNLLNPCFDFTDPKSEFEKICSEEEKTQFDFFVEDITSGQTCSIEVKYSESGFGSTIGDTRHLDKFLKEYEANIKVLSNVAENDWHFFEYYQIWRNLLYTIRNPGQHVCFLFPRFREDLKKTLESVISKCKEECRSFFHIIIADDVVEQIINSNSPMRTYYEEFKKKYLDIELS